MKQITRAFLVVMLLVGLSGCANERFLDLSEKALDVIPEDVGRFSAHVAVRRAEEATKREAIKAEKANEDADRAFDQKVAIPNPTTDVQAMAAANIEQSRTMRRIVMDLAKAIGGKNEFELATTPTPKGAISEGIDSAGNAIAKVADTPAALATSVGVAAVKISKAAIKEAGDTVQGGDYSPITTTKTTTNTKTESSNSGQDGVATGTTGGEQADNVRSDDNSVTDAQP